MKKWLVVWTVVWLTVVLICPVSANNIEIITFDDVLEPNVNWGVVPDGYMGLDWKHIEVERITDYRQTYNNRLITFPSAPLAALNGGESGGNRVVSFSSPKPILLGGAYFSTWAEHNWFADFSSHELTVAGYLNGKEMGSKTFSLTPDFAWQAFDFGLVDQVVFTHLERDNAHWWLMDNVQVSAIPIPATIGMFCGGLLALVVFGRRRVGGH
jgi:hypothetical protein